MVQPWRELIPLYATRQASALALAGVLSAALLAASAIWAVPAAPALTGAAYVIDGDTISLGGLRVRLEGIDAPELDQSCGAGPQGSWPCGRAAAAHLGRLASGRVSCRITGYDAYGRSLGVCTAGGQEINAQMVRDGMAWAFVRYGQTYAAAEAEARERRIGVWRGAAEPAWSYRARRAVEQR
jgi:endonuclease YncB( thermonuclease family)